MNHQEFVGKKVIGRWGSLEPEWAGKISGAGKVGVTIRWNNGKTQYATYGELRNDYAEPAGSPVGLYVHVEEYV